MGTLEPKNIYLTQKEFDKDLEICLTILHERLDKGYYVCEYISASLHKSIVNIFIKKN